MSNINLNSDTENDDDNEKVKENQPGTKEQAEQIVQTSAIISRNGRYKIYCLTIIGQIEGHYILSSQNKTTKYEHVIPQLVAIEEDLEIDGLILLLNTVGGDVEAGLAIAELVAGMNKPTVSLVLGGGHSIGVPLAVCTDESFIVKSATMTIHPVRMSGTMIGVSQTFEYFQRMQKRIAKFITEHSSISMEKFYDLVMNTSEMAMDIGTVLDGKDAVEVGLIDKLGTLSDAIECLYKKIDERKSKSKNFNSKTVKVRKRK